MVLTKLSRELILLACCGCFFWGFASAVMGGNPPDVYSQQVYISPKLTPPPTVTSTPTVTPTATPTPTPSPTPKATATVHGTVALPVLPRQVAGRELLRFSGSARTHVFKTLPAFAGKVIFQFACVKSQKTLTARIFAAGKLLLSVTNLPCVGMVDRLTTTTKAVRKGFVIDVYVSQTAEIAVLITQTVIPG